MLLLLEFNYARAWATLLFDQECAKSNPFKRSFCLPFSLLQQPMAPSFEWCKFSKTQTLPEKHLHAKIIYWSYVGNIVYSINKFVHSAFCRYITLCWCLNHTIIWLLTIIQTNLNSLDIVTMLHTLQVANKAGMLHEMPDLLSTLRTMPGAPLGHTIVVVALDRVAL